MITSTSNPLVKHIRKLKQKKVRQQTGEGFVDGLRGALTAAEHAPHLLKKIVIAPDLLTGSEAENRLTEVVTQDQIVPVSAAVYRSLSERENPAGMGAIVQSPLVPLNSLTPQTNTATYVILDRIGDPGNLGTIIRTADAAGMSGVIMVGAGVDVLHPSTLRASLGTAFTVPIARSTVADFAAWQRAQNIFLLGTSANAKTQYNRFKGSGPTALLLGNEREGLNQELTAMANQMVTIPMQGQASSLNLAVAAGIMMFTLRSQD